MGLSKCLWQRSILSYVRIVLNIINCVLYLKHTALLRDAERLTYID